MVPLGWLKCAHAGNSDANRPNPLERLTFERGGEINDQQASRSHHSFQPSFRLKLLGNVRLEWLNEKSLRIFLPYSPHQIRLQTGNGEMAVLVTVNRITMKTFFLFVFKLCLLKHLTLFIISPTVNPQKLSNQRVGGGGATPPWSTSAIISHRDGLCVS